MQTGYPSIRGAVAGLIKTAMCVGFVAVATTATAQNCPSGPVKLVVPPALPVKSVSELVAYAKANPGKLSHGSFGIGTYAHLSMEDLARHRDESLIGDILPREAAYRSKRGTGVPQEFDGHAAP